MTVGTVVDGKDTGGLSSATSKVFLVPYNDILYQKTNFDPGTLRESGSGSFGLFRPELIDDKFVLFVRKLEKSNPQKLVRED